jgi:hypothetical protein
VFYRFPDVSVSWVYPGRPVFGPRSFGKWGKNPSTHSDFGPSRRSNARGRAGFIFDFTFYPSFVRGPFFSGFKTRKTEWFGDPGLSK